MRLAGESVILYWNLFKNNHTYCWVVTKSYIPLRLSRYALPLIVSRKWRYSNVRQEIPSTVKVGLHTIVKCCHFWRQKLHFLLHCMQYFVTMFQRERPNAVSCDLLSRELQVGRRERLQDYLHVHSTVWAMYKKLGNYVAKKNRKCFCWVRKWIDWCPEFGAYASLLSDLAIEDLGQYKAFLRMTPWDLEDLLAKIGPVISRQETILTTHPCQR